MKENKKIQTILFVEDEKKIQESLSDVLQDYCEELYLADDGQEGLSQFQKHRPQIVVTDIKMPHKNGIEMVQEIKKIDPTVRVIFTTAFSDDEFLESAIHLQVDGYILKPISLDQLETKLSDLVESIIQNRQLEKLKSIVMELEDEEKGV